MAGLASSRDYVHSEVGMALIRPSILSKYHVRPFVLEQDQMEIELKRCW